MSKQAIDGKRMNAFGVDPNDVVVVLDHDHFLYDARAEEPLSEERIANFDAFGVLEPVLVWKDPTAGVTGVVAGRKRTLGLRVANARRVARGEEPHLLPVIAVKGDETALTEIMILENEGRDEDSPLNKARKTKKYMDLLESAGAERSETKLRAAVVFGVTTKTVEARLKLLELKPEVQQAVEKRKIGFWAATELHGLGEEEQQAGLQHLLEASETTGRRPTIEGAKAAAGKDGAKARERLAKALEALKEAAVKYGRVPGVHTTAALKETAREYEKSVEKARKK